MWQQSVNEWVNGRGESDHVSDSGSVWASVAMCRRMMQCVCECGSVFGSGGRRVEASVAVCGRVGQDVGECSVWVVATFPLDMQNSIYQSLCGAARQHADRTCACA